jgi:hypothetical protein
MDILDSQRLRAEEVRQLQADALAANTDAHDLSQRAIRERLPGVVTHLGNRPRPCPV